MEYKAGHDSGVVILAKEDGVVDKVDGRHHRHQAMTTASATRLSPDQVRPLQPGHLHQPAPGRFRGQSIVKAVTCWRTARPPKRAKSRWASNAAHRLHDLGRLQLRGRRSAISEKLVKRRRVHLHPHRGIRIRSPRHQAGTGRDHPRHPERRRGRAEGSGRARHHPHRCGGSRRRHSGRQGHAQGRNRADRAKSACCAPSSAKRRARSATPPCACRTARAASWST